jgi:hypothetical protein
LYSSTAILWEKNLKFTLCWNAFRSGEFRYEHRDKVTKTVLNQTLTFLTVNWTTLSTAHNTSLVVLKRNNVCRLHVRLYVLYSLLITVKILSILSFSKTLAHNRPLQEVNIDSNISLTGRIWHNISVFGNTGENHACKKHGKTHDVH